MKFNSLNSFSSLIILITFVLIFSLCLFIPVLSQYGYIASYSPNSSNTVTIDFDNCTWPTPGYTTITSNFGYRNSPFTGKTVYHSGLDIGAPTGTNIIAIFSGEVTYTGFSGANGFTVTVTNGNISSSYSHVSPNFLVYVGQYVYQGDIIAIVGPKNVYGVPNNPYRDSNGNPTNRVNYWSSSAFKHKRRRQSRQSFKLFLITYRLHHHDYNDHNRVRIRHHSSHLPSLILLCYYTLDILFHLLIHRYLQ